MELDDDDKTKSAALSSKVNRNKEQWQSHISDKKLLLVISGCLNVKIH